MAVRATKRPYLVGWRWRISEREKGGRGGEEDTRGWDGRREQRVGFGGSQDSKVT